MTQPRPRNGATLAALLDQPISARVEAYPLRPCLGEGCVVWSELLIDSLCEHCRSSGNRKRKSE